MRSINKESTSKSSKGSKKKKKKKKKTRLSLFQKKEDERVANKDSK